MQRAAKLDRSVYEAYAKEFGVSVRTAQHHRKTENPQWKAWERGQVVSRVIGQKEEKRAETIKAHVELLIPEDVDLDGMDPHQAMERAALETWRAIEQRRRRAVNEPGLAHNLPALCKAEMEAQERYRKAKRARESAEVAAGSLIEARALAPVRVAMAAVGRLMSAAHIELGPRVNPPDPNYASQAVQEWIRTRFNPALQDVLKEVAHLTEPEPEDVAA